MTPPIHIATDGSSSGGLAGYGVATSTGRLAYGRTEPGFNGELDAIEHALRLFPEGPLVIRTDCDEALRAFAEGMPPSPKSSNREQIAGIANLLAGRTGPVEFRRVAQRQQQDALHAVAHLLAFLGRTGRDLDEEMLANAAERILASETPDDVAHTMVRVMLFPASQEAQAYTGHGASPTLDGHVRRNQHGHPLSEDVEHFEAICPVHGLTLFARHRAGFRAGAQRYKERCLACHSDYNLAHPSGVVASSPEEPEPHAEAEEHGEVVRSMPVTRKAVIRPGALRSVLGADLAEGMVLATGIILRIERDEDDEGQWLEMPGADVHYVADDEPVTVLAELDRAALDLFSVGVYLARKGA